MIEKIVFLTPFLSERDWVANSRFCRYLRSHSVGAAPNYWLYALVRCDGKCDPGDSLDIPFRVSPTINNPPRSEIEMSPVLHFHKQFPFNLTLHSIDVRQNPQINRCHIRDSNMHRM